MWYEQAVYRRAQVVRLSGVFGSLLSKQLDPPADQVGDRGLPARIVDSFCPVLQVLVLFGSQHHDVAVEFNHGVPLFVRFTSPICSTYLLLATPQLIPVVGLTVIRDLTPEITMAKTLYEILINLEGGDLTMDQLEAAERQVNLLTQAADAVAPVLSAAGQQMLDFSNRAALANADMERGLTNLQVIMGATAEEAEQYNEQLDDVLTRTNDQIGINDALTASYDAASAGFRDSADALGVTESSINLAIAGTSGLDQATDNLRSSQRAIIVGLKNYESELSTYGDTTAQAARVSDLLNKTIEQGITDIGQLAPQFAEIAPTAAAAGVSIEELSAAYAAATSTGTGTAQVTTGIKAALDAIARGGATAEAKKLIEETGIAFNMQGLEAKGLIGILEDLEGANLTTLDSLLELTGSTEAASFLANLTGDMERTRETFGGFNEELNSTADIAATKGTDALAKLTAATNRFDKELAKAGENLAPIESKLLNLASSVLEAFNGLPEGLQQVIGSIVVVGGATATAGGSAIQLASDIAVARIAYMTWAAQMKTTNGLLGIQAVKTAAVTKAQAAYNLAIGTTVTGLGALAVTAGAAVAAVAALTLAYQQYQNIRTQERNMETLSDFQQTEVLAQRVSTLVLKMRETGEAIPDEEFRQWNQLLEQANDESGSLTGIIDAFNSVQQQAKDGTLETADALDKQAEATKDATTTATEATKATQDQATEAETAAEAQERQAEAAREAQEANAELLDTLQKGLGAIAATVDASEIALEQAVQQGTITTQAAYEERARILAVQAESTRALYFETMANENLLAEDRARLLSDYQRDMRAAQRERLQLQRQQAQELQRINAENSERELLALETKADRELWTEERKTQAIRELKQRQLQATIETVEAELASVVRGSDRERQLTMQKMRAEAEQASLVAQTNREMEAAHKARIEATMEAERQATEEAKRQAEEAKQARIDAWQAETDAYLQTLQERVSQASRIGDRINQALSARQATGNLAGSVVGDFEGTLGAREQATQRIAEITAQIAQYEAEAAETGESRNQQIREARAELEQQQNIRSLTNTELRNTSNLLAEMGVNLDAQLTAEQASMAIVREQLAIKNQQIELELQQERIKIRLQQLEQQRLILELERKATAEDITETEARNLRMQIENAQAAKQLLGEQLRASEQLAGLQQAANAQSARSGLAAQGIDPKELGKEFRDANKELGSQLTEPLKDLLTGEKESRSAIVEQLTQGSQAVTSGLVTLEQGFGAAVDPLRTGIQNSNGIQQQGFGSQLAATQAQTAELAAQLRALQAATAAIPGQLAALMPRPAPPSRD